MTNQATIRQLTTKNTLNIAMYLTMAISLIIISVFAFSGSSGCTSVNITSKNNISDKYYYQFSDGSGAWSSENYPVNEQVCVSTQNTALAQKY